MDNTGDQPIPTNEEIIDEITKDLESSFHIAPQGDNVKVDKSPETDSTLKDNPPAQAEKSSSIAHEGKSHIPPDFEDETSDDRFKDECDFDDIIDEVALKDLEVTLSDEDKKRLCDEAKGLKDKGNEQFKAGEFHESALTYTKALRLCPLVYEKDRAVLYSNRAAAKSKLGLSMSAIEDCSKAVELDDRYLKAVLRRAQLYKETEKLDEALEDYKKVLEIDPYHAEARRALMELPALINERNEKLKTEMISKLKDVGNLFLRPFGLSTDDFKVNKDPNTGGYSISMGKQ